jgi:hypothetical protein
MNQNLRTLRQEQFYRGAELDENIIMLVSIMPLVYSF